MLAVLAAVLDRVGEQIQQRLHRHLAIDCHVRVLGRRRHRDRDLLPLALAQARERRHRLARHLAGPLAPAQVAAGAALDLRVVEQVGDEQAEPLALLDDDLVVAALAVAVVAGHALLQHLGEHADRGERRLELVRHGGDEVALEPGQLALARGPADGGDQAEDQHRDQAAGHEQVAPAALAHHLGHRIGPRAVLHQRQVEVRQERAERRAGQRSRRSGVGAVADRQHDRANADLPLASRHRQIRHPIEAGPLERQPDHRAAGQPAVEQRPVRRAQRWTAARLDLGAARQRRQVIRQARRQPRRALRQHQLALQRGQLLGLGSVEAAVAQKLAHVIDEQPARRPRDRRVAGHQLAQTVERRRGRRLDLGQAELRDERVAHAVGVDAIGEAAGQLAVERGGLGRPLGGALEAREAEQRLGAGVAVAGELRVGAARLGQVAQRRSAGRARRDPRLARTDPDLLAAREVQQRGSGRVEAHAAAQQRHELLIRRRVERRRRRILRRVDQAAVRIDEDRLRRDRMGRHQRLQPGLGTALVAAAVAIARALERCRSGVEGQAQLSGDRVGHAAGQPAVLLGDGGDHPAVGEVRDRAEIRDAHGRREHRGGREHAPERAPAHRLHRASITSSAAPAMVVADPGARPDARHLDAPQDRALTC